MNHSPLHRIIHNLHQFIGLIIGPFIIVAALTGCVYALANLIETPAYRKVLFVDQASVGEAHSYADQLKASDKYIQGEDLRFFAFRPAPDSKSSSRVLYTSSKLKESEYYTVFVNPYDLKVIGNLSTYGTSGAMPTRMMTDFIHRDLLLNSLGRFYSEIAASWMWVGALTGLYLFFKRKKKFFVGSSNYIKNFNLHLSLGLLSVFGLLFLSVTGLTWSKGAGEKISAIRNELNWHTPSIDKRLREYDNSKGNIIENPDRYYSLFDKVAMVARENGITSNFIEIRAGKNQLEAWTVGEYQRAYPTKVDTVAIDPYKLEAVSAVRFKDFNLMAKLTRWGIDFHMGALFGPVNQILLVIISLAIALLVFTGMRSRYLLPFSKEKFQLDFLHYIDSYFELTRRQGLSIALVVLLVSYVIPWILYTLALKFLIEAFIYYKLKKKLGNV